MSTLDEILQTNCFRHNLSLLIQKKSKIDLFTNACFVKITQPILTVGFIQKSLLQSVLQDQGAVFHAFPVWVIWIRPLRSPHVSGYSLDLGPIISFRVSAFSPSGASGQELWSGISHGE